MNGSYRLGNSKLADYERCAGCEYVRCKYRENPISDYLQTQSWHYMLTVTFRNQRKDAIYNRGQLWNYLTPFASRGFLISEPHASGFLHYHGLIFTPRFQKLNISDWIEKDLTHTFGWSSVSGIRSMREVAGYCAKYVTKAVDDPSIDYDFMGDWSK